MADSALQRGLAERFARIVRDVGGAPPVNLEGIARLLGVREINYADLTEDGRTTWIDGHPRIDLASNKPANRTRFTLAHEIGHILINGDKTVAHRTDRLTHDAVETLCDWIAASILMPRDWIQPYSGRDRMTLSLVRLVSHRAGVSLSAAVVRLAEVGGRTCMLLRWKKAPRRWVVVGQAGVPRQYAGLLQATADTNATLETLPYRRDVWREISLTAGSATLTGHAHVDRGRQDCLTLFTSLQQLNHGAG